MNSVIVMDEYKNRGLTGLQNLGNTCYMNTIIQVLSHTYELHEFFKDTSWTGRVTNRIDSLILVEFDKLIQFMWKENCTISPKGFVSFVHKLAKRKNNSNFSGWNQNDASEFLIFLLEGFHNALTYRVKISISGTIKNETDEVALKCWSRFRDIMQNDYSDMVDIFYGIQATVIYDMTVGATRSSKRTVLSIAAEPFFVMNIPVPPSANNIYDCLNTHTEVEYLTGDNKWFNDKLGDGGAKQDAMKEMSFWTLPKVLIIDLKRYNYSGNKNQRMIEFPLDGLDMRPYVIGYDKDKYIYDCYGICNHSGSMQGGHYTAFVKNANGKWYHFNDSIVDVIDKKHVVSPKAYCLFYRIRS